MRLLNICLASIALAVPHDGAINPLAAAEAPLVLEKTIPLAGVAGRMII
jgi:hypothetical protein